MVDVKSINEINTKMPKPQERDLEETKVVFKSWLETKLPDASSFSVEMLGGPENTGFSNETLSFNVAYQLNGSEISSGMSSGIGASPILCPGGVCGRRCTKWGDDEQHVVRRRPGLAPQDHDSPRPPEEGRSIRVGERVEHALTRPMRVDRLRDFQLGPESAPLEDSVEPVCVALTGGQRANDRSTFALHDQPALKRQRRVIRYRLV